MRKSLKVKITTGTLLQDHRPIRKIQPAVAKMSAMPRQVALSTEDSTQGRDVATYLTRPGHVIFVMQRGVCLFFPLERQQIWLTRCVQLAETGCRRRCETRRPRFATQILDAF